jgi:hypothetical protein
LGGCRLLGLSFFYRGLADLLSLYLFLSWSLRLHIAASVHLKPDVLGGGILEDNLSWKVS